MTAIDGVVPAIRGYAVIFSRSYWTAWGRDNCAIENDSVLTIMLV